MNKDLKIALTGFMGVGKSSVARHLAHVMKCQWVDLDRVIEQNSGRVIADIIDQDGIESYRTLESENLERTMNASNSNILSLGGGTWTVPANRELLKNNGFTSVWLESTFEHCWLNITYSRKDRPLARNKVETRRLFDERQKVYCLADWHFIIRPDYTSYEVAKQIVEEIFS
ncbi:MAG TPA: shikimate kinase [Pyrinomonadaceae bacterium]|jgi:shikimate kinase|nr:shikimate kinase [Pyrinomonadaceae bacterium]